MYIDVEKLRQDLLNDCYAACFSGGYGGAMAESWEIENMSDEEIIRIARRKGINLKYYEIEHNEY